MRRFVSALVLLVSALMPSLSQAQGHESWSAPLSVYEVNVRQYTPEGTLDAFETHLDRLDALGVGILWFMPVHPIGQENRLGTLGSYYSVRDFYGINPEFGTMEGLQRVVDAAHDRGMKVLIDWVANHTAWDHPLTEEHPEWYVTDVDGDFIPPPGTNWTDVIELDYSQPGLRAYMIDAMTYWMEEVGVDGFRFDAVDFVPDSFWEEATAALREVDPDVFLLAEGDRPDLPALGFDASFGWGLYGFGYGALKEIADGAADAFRLNAYLAYEAETFPDHYRLHFTANHDENSWYGTTDELFGDAAESFAVLTFAVPGLPLIYSGQEAGLDRRLAFFDKDEIVWRDHPNADLYRTLLHLKRDNRALWNGAAGGALRRITTTNQPRVFAFLRESDGDRVLGAFNLTDSPTTVTLVGQQHLGTYRDAFTGEPVTVESGASLALPAWGYALYESRTDGTGVDQARPSPRLSLGPIRPNPVQHTAVQAYTVPAPSDVHLVLVDVLGREVRVLDSGRKATGQHTALVDVTGLPAGIYTLRLRAGDSMVTRRLVVVR